MVTWTIHYRVESTADSVYTSVTPQEVFSRTVTLDGMRKDGRNHVRSFRHFTRFNNSADISGYHRLRDTNGTLNQDVSTSVFNITEETINFVKAYVTDLNLFEGFNWNNHVSGTLRIRAWLTSSSQFLLPQSAKVGIEIYHRDSGGTETIKQSILTPKLTLFETNYDIDTSFGDTYFDTDERLVIKTYGVFVPLL